MGAFIEPIQLEFGWSRSQITSGLLVTSVSSVLLAPLLGRLTDRFGTRRIAIPGVVVYCLGLGLLSQTHAVIASWWALWGVIALGSLMIKPTVWSIAVSSRFLKSRGLALALMLCGTGLASTLTPFVSTILIERFGWRLAYMALAGGWAAVALPLLLLFFHDARSRQAPKAAASPPPVIQTGLGVRDGFKSRAFPRLMAAAFCITLALIAMMVHLVPLLTEGGLQRKDAAAIAGIVGLTSITGRIITGLLLDRLSGPHVGMVSVLLPIIPVCLFLAAPGSLPMAIVAVAILGLALGGELDAIIYLSSRFFGLLNFGTLFGFVMAMFSFATGLGPFLGSLIFDATGSYTLMLVAVVPLCLVAAFMLGTLGPYPADSKPGH